MNNHKAMRVKDFYAIIEKDLDPDVSMLAVMENLVNRFPVFQAGLFIYLKCLYIADAPNFISELTRLTPFIHDRRALFYYILRSLYHKFKVKVSSRKQLQDRTSSLINAFFENLGDDYSEVDDLLGDVMKNTSIASHDYFSYMNNEKEDNLIGEKEEEVIVDVEINEKKLKNQDLIDRFISESEDSSGILPDLKSVAITDYELPSLDGDSEDEESMVDNQDEDFFFTQTLVDIYIKQKKYERAYEIIKRLNLNNSEKNIYFASQLSFLEKQIKILNNK